MILHPFNSISVISGQWDDDNERLCAVELCLPVEILRPQVGLEAGTARSGGQHLTHRANGASGPNEVNLYHQTCFYIWEFCKV